MQFTNFCRKLVLSRFTRFCVEKKINQRMRVWRKNDKYQVCFLNWQNLFSCDLRTFVWRKIEPKIACVEKKWQISGMVPQRFIFLHFTLHYGLELKVQKKWNSGVLSTLLNVFLIMKKELVTSAMRWTGRSIEVVSRAGNLLFFPPLDSTRERTCYIDPDFCISRVSNCIYQYCVQMLVVYSNWSLLI